MQHRQHRTGLYPRVHGGIVVTYDAKETEQLLNQYSRTRDTALRNELAERFVPLAAKTARKFIKRGAEYDDLFQVAMVALLKALDRYDGERGVKFTTFAVPTMVGEVKNYLRDHSSTLRLPRTSSEALLRMRGAEVALVQRLGRTPTAAEMAQELGETEERVLELLSAANSMQFVSLDTVPDEDMDSPLAWLGEEERGYEDVERRELLRAAFAVLNAEERRILTERYLNSRTQSDLAKEMGVTQMYISRREKRIFQKLREQIKP